MSDSEHKDFYGSRIFPISISTYLTGASVRCGYCFSSSQILREKNTGNKSQVVLTQDSLDKYLTPTRIGHFFISDVFTGRVIFLITFAIVDVCSTYQVPKNGIIFLVMNFLQNTMEVGGNGL